MEPWQQNLIEDRDGARHLLKEARRLAIIGIKPESRAGQPAHHVPAYLQRAGYEIIPVPCHYPEVDEILGRKVYRKLTDVPGTVDMVVVFRRPADIPQHLPEILAIAPRAVWFQSGIRNDAAAEQLARAGILVVQDRCAMVEHRQMAG